jgi:HD-GYP domain-containing protein (c-di-GMP phosphodiesterase class II)
MPSAIDSSALAELGARLEEAFGARFRLRVLDQYEFARMQRMQKADDQATSSPGRKKMRLLRRGDVVKLHLQFDALPGAPVLAVAGFRRRSARDLRRLANFFLTHWELRRMLAEYEQYFNDCATQMGRHLEEFVLLHKLAERLQQTDLTQSPWNLAELVLPIVAEVIRAEAIMLLPNKAAHSPCGLCASQPIVITGDRALGDEHECRALVQICHSDERRQPTVRNWSGYAPECPPRIRNLVIAGLYTGEVPLGWLVAMNRRREPQERRGSSCEFGSVEAQLLNSIAAMLASQARNVGLYREREALLVAVVRALVSAVDAKDPYTCGHSERVALVARRLARECGLDEQECERIYLTGLLHDVGKIGVSDAVLSKPGKLTPAEFDEIKRHTELGWSILCELEQLRYVLPGVLHHHETFHGQGYPDALSGESIPLVARILAVADAFDAMASDRPYRPGMEISKVTTILREGAGTQWDPWVIDRFFAVFPQIEALWQAHSTRPPLENRRVRQRCQRAEEQSRAPLDCGSTAIAELSRHV